MGHRAGPTAPVPLRRRAGAISPAAVGGRHVDREIEGRYPVDPFRDARPSDAVAVGRRGDGQPDDHRDWGRRADGPDVASEPATAGECRSPTDRVQSEKSEQHAAPSTVHGVVAAAVSFTFNTRHHASLVQPPRSPGTRARFAGRVVATPTSPTPRTVHVRPTRAGRRQVSRRAAWSGRRLVRRPPPAAHGWLPTGSPSCGRRRRRAAPTRRSASPPTRRRRVPAAQPDRRP